MRLYYVLLAIALVASSVRAGLDESFAALISRLETETGKQIESQTRQQWLASLKKSLVLQDFEGDRKPEKLMHFIRSGGLGRQGYGYKASYEHTVLPFLESGEDSKPAHQVLESIGNLHEAMQNQNPVVKAVASSSSSKSKSRWNPFR